MNIYQYQTQYNQLIFMHLLQQEVQLYLGQNNIQRSQNTNTKKASIFVPFIKERDSMGRLIKNQLCSLKLIETQSTDSRSPIKLKQKLQKSLTFMEGKMQKYFKHVTPITLSQSTKQKIYKKTKIQMISQRPQSHSLQKANVQPSKTTKQLLLIRKFTQSANLIKTKSVFNASSPKKEAFIKRSHSSMLTSRKHNEQERRQNRPSSVSKRDIFEPNVIFDQSSGFYPELSRVRKMKQLQVKLQSDFEQRHGQFLDKLIKSKQIAYQVKIGLQKIDEIY